MPEPPIFVKPQMGYQLGLNFVFQWNDNNDNDNLTKI